MRRLLVAIVMLAALVTPLASPKPARADDQILQWEDGSSFAIFGANASVTIGFGTILFACDFVFPTADIYVIQGSAGGTLSDVSGAPNTVIAGSGGAFTDTIAFTEPTGDLGEGTYSVVYDECQDGNLDDIDAVFPNAFQVILPSTLPPVDSSILGMKSSAGRLADRMQTLLNLLELYEAYQELQEAIECITGFADCVLSMFVDELTGMVIDQIKVILGLTVDPKLAGRDAAVDTISHYKGIEADPPDPAFQQQTLIDSPQPIDPETNDPLVGAEVALGNAHQNEGALAEALLHAIERYQGAAAADDGDWALVHAREIQTFATLLAGQLDDSNAALTDLANAVNSDPRDIGAVSAELAPERARIVASGFTPEEEQLLLNLGMTQADTDALLARIADQGTDAVSNAALVTALNDLAAENNAAIADLQTLASDMDAFIADVADDPAVVAGFPVADAGGPYVAAQGASVALDGSGSNDPDGSVATFDWDLDGDGQFDDASGATPSVSFAEPFAGSIGLRVTDDTGHTGVDYAAIAVTATNSPPVIASFSPNAVHPEVIVGTSQVFDVNAGDPDGDAVSVSWLLDGESAGSGPSFSYSPVEADGLGGHWLRAVVTAGGATRVHDWSPTVLLPDADSDGWHANVDCDDSDPAVNPGATEVLGNGKDDDCDATTPDGGDGPVAFFNPVMNNGGSNAASYEQGARTVAFAPSQFQPQSRPDTMLDDYVGLPANRWVAGVAPNMFAKIDLVGDEPVVIDRVRIQGSSTGLTVKTFEIAVSTTTTDDSAFTTVLTAVAAKSDAVQEFVLPAPARAKFVRYRIIDSYSTNPSFTLRFQTWTGQVGTGTTVTFDNLSTDANNDIVSFEWDFGDGSPPSSEQSPTHTFPGPGDYTVTLTATDAIGNTGVFSVVQRILAPPPTPDILLYGPTLVSGAVSTEYAEAVKLGLTPRIVSETEWKTLTTADFAGYRAIVFGDASFAGTSPALLNSATSNTSWGPAVTGNIIVLGGDMSVHAAKGGATMFNRSIQFAIEQPGKTGVVVVLGQYYFNVGANTPVPVLDVLRPGEFGVQGAGCHEPAHFTANHLAFDGITDANLLGWGCVVHEVFTRWPSDFVVITAAVGIGNYVNTDGSVGQPHIVAIGTNITPITRITLAPASAEQEPGQPQTLTATVKNGGVPTPNVTVTFTVTSGPNTGVTKTAITNASGVATFSYTGSQGGTDEIVATFVDAEVTHTSNAATVTWLGSSLSVDAGGDQAAVEGDTVSLSSATFSDSGPSGTHTATIDWGDGTVENGTVTESLGSVAGSHIYQDNGVFTVELCVSNAGGTTGCDTLLVTVANAPPVVSVGTAPNLTAGDVVTLEVATFADAGTLDTHTATVDWGDGTIDAGTVSQGTGSGSVSGTHAYAAGGDYTVTITVTDDDGDSGSDTAVITVANANGAPTLTVIGDQTIDEGTAVDINILALDPNDDPVTITATGLPAFASFSVVGPNSATLNLAPDFDDAGVYPDVTISASDGALTTTQTFTITVNDGNRPPVAIAGADQSVAESDAVTLDAGNSSDLDGDGLSFSWELVDSSGPAVSLSAPDSANPSFTTTDDGVYTFQVTVDDGQGGTASDQVVVTVTNVAPSVEPGGPYQVLEGGTLQFGALGEFNPFGDNEPFFFEDPGFHDTQTATISWGDGTTSAGDVFGGGSNGQVSGQHLYADNLSGNSSYNGEVCVSDDDGGTGCAPLEVVVLNVAPTVQAGNDLVANEGDGVSLDQAGFTDPGTLDVHTATIDWGDGTNESFVLAQGTPDIVGSHTYLDDANYTVVVTVCDDDGDCGSDAVVVEVRNVLPVIDPIADISVNTGQPFSGAATLSDPGVEDGWEILINYDDGAFEQFVITSVAPIPFGHTYSTTGDYTLRLCVDDGGHQVCVTATVHVVNTPPVADAGPDQSVDEGSLVTLVGGGSFDPDGDPLTYAWRVVSSTGPAVMLSATDSISPSFATTNDGVYTFEVAVDDGRGGTDTDQVVITVANVAPTASIDNAPADSPEGTAIDLTGSATDPGTADGHTFVWDVAKDGAAYATGTGDTFSFTPADNGSYLMTLTVTDDDGGIGTDSTTITVANVAPSVTLAGAASLHQGETFSTAGAFTDPGADTWTGTVDYGDGSGVQPLLLNSDRTFGLSHAYTTAGSFTIQVCVSDDEGDSGCAVSQSITVERYAIFAGRDDCGQQSVQAIHWSGSGGLAIGDAHSTSGLKVSGSNNKVDGAATYRCTKQVSGSENTFTEGVTKVSEVRPWPNQLNREDFTCDFTQAGKLDLDQDGPWWVGGSKVSRQLVGMTLCADEITLSGSDISGTVTLVAGTINLSGSGLHLQPHQYGVLAFATGTGKNALKVSGSHNQLSGDLVARWGQVELSGSGWRIANGSVIGWTVKLTGSNWTIDARLS